MAVPAEVAAAAGLEHAARVSTDTVPPDLAKAMAARAATRAAWAKLAPAQKREHVKQVIEAKKPETRARRIAATLAALERG